VTGVLVALQSFRSVKKDFINFNFCLNDSSPDIPGSPHERKILLELSSTGTAKKINCTATDKYSISTQENNFTRPNLNLDCNSQFHEKIYFHSFVEIFQYPELELSGTQV